MADLVSVACDWAPRNLTWKEWNRFMEGPYHPTCVGVPLPLNAIEGILGEAGKQVRAGDIQAARQRIEQLNEWLTSSGQAKFHAVDVDAFIAEAQAEVSRD
jgi:hypothetical protein